MVRLILTLFVILTTFRHLEIWIQPFYQNAKKSNRNNGIRIILRLT